MNKKVKWRALEANPAVIKEYVKCLGGPENVHFTDVLSIEDWALEMIPKPVHALLLVYPITEKAEKFSQDCQKEKTQECIDDVNKQHIMDKIWFTKQTVGNACGTVALLHIFGNLKNQLQFESNGYMKSFFDDMQKLTPDERATALETNEYIQSAHTRAEEGGQSRHRSEVIEHFIAFIEIDGYLIELDGRKRQPLIHQKIKSNFLSSAASIIKSNYMDIDPNELRFSMIAVTGNPNYDSI